MQSFRRYAIPLLTLLLIGFCGSCMLLTNVVAWVAGRDLGQREVRAELSATSQADLPPLGVLVTRLDRGGPADQAGIMRGDTITALDGTAVQDARDLRDLLLNCRPGQTVKITVLRDQGTTDLSVTLVAASDAASRAYLGIFFTARVDGPGDL